MADIENGQLTFRGADGRSGYVRSFGPDDRATLRRALQIVYGLFPQYSTDENYAAGSFRIYQGDLYKAVAANGPSTTTAAPGNESYWVKVMTSDEVQGARNIGEVFYSALPVIDAGVHLLDGTLLQGDGIYSDFIAYIKKLYEDNSSAPYFTDETSWQNEVIAHGSCGKFVFDNTTNTVRLPKIVGAIDATTDPAVLTDLQVYSYASGNLEVNKTKLYVYIVIANIQKTPTAVSIDNIASDLNGKTDTDLGNLPDSSHVKIAHDAMPSTKRIVLTFSGSEVSYVAPADGYFFTSYASPSGSSKTRIWMINVDANIGMTTHTNASNQSMACTLPAAKGQSVIVRIATNIESDTQANVSFVYANGSVSEA